MERGGDALEESDRDADLFEQNASTRSSRFRKRTSNILASSPSPSSQSDGYIEICDTYRKKHSCKCYVLLELHKIISMLRRRFDVRVVTTQGQDLKHTKCHHLDLTRSITKWESMCSRSLTQLACASQS